MPPMTKVCGWPLHGIKHPTGRMVRHAYRKPTRRPHPGVIIPLLVVATYFCGHHVRQESSNPASRFVTTTYDR